MTPTMKPKTVERVSIKWMLDNISYSADFGTISDHTDFLEIIHCKSHDSCMGPLVDSILENGFTIPICIQLGTGFTLGNGHHRFVAALLLAVDDIPVYWSDTDYMCSYATTGADQGWDHEDNIGKLLG